MKNNDIAQLFENMGTLLEIQGENVFKIRAYFKAAENIRNLGEDITDVANENRLAEVGGIGKTLQSKIEEYLKTGKLESYQKLTKDVPETLLDIVHVPSVGPKKAKLFYDQLKIVDLAGLKRAAEDGRILKLAGVKEKTVENIKKGVEIVFEGQERMNLGVATDAALSVIKYLKGIKGVKRIESAGSLRRGKETVGDIDILLCATNPTEVMDAFVHMPSVKKINAQGDTKSSVLIDKNIQVDLRIVDESQFGSALLYFTGSKNFNIHIRQIAIKQDKKVSEYGVFDVSKAKEKCLASMTEEECFKALKLPFIVPELREEIGEKQLFQNKGKVVVPELLELKDIKGEFHVHSTYSDGKNTIAQMVEAAKARGYSYLAISDHSVKLRVAHGVSIEDLKKKKSEIDLINQKEKNFKVLFGTELEIDADGNLDYNDKVLSEFDIVVASIHSGFEQSKAKLTKRLLNAITNKHVNIIGHPTGIHIGKRKGYDIDLKEVCKAAVDHNVFLEINAAPVRLDLNSSNVYYAKQMGVRFCVNTDAHRVEHLDFMKYGVAIARRGWLGKDDVLNTHSYSQMKRMLGKSGS